MSDLAVDAFIGRELRSILLGEQLGRGIARTVYRNAADGRYVVKIEDGAKSFQNVAEWELWGWVSGTPMSKWFAPCRSISAAGAVLVMDYVEPLRTAELPKRLPAFLCDLKPENFGMLDGRVVARDYGTCLWAIRATNRRLVKAKWR